MKEINIRRSVRSYNSEKVSKEDILKILKSGMQAPSAGNQQAWEFIVIENKDSLQELTNISKYARAIGESSFSVLVLGTPIKARFVENIEQDLGAVCQNMLLEATHLGIGSLWTAVSPLKDRMDFAKKHFNLNDNLLPYALIAFGYPKDESAFKFKDYFDESKIHYEKY